MSEMATAVLNGLTNNRHSDCLHKLKSMEEKATMADTCPSDEGEGEEVEEMEPVAGEGYPDSASGDVHQVESSQLVKDEMVHDDGRSESVEVASERSDSQTVSVEGCV